MDNTLFPNMDVGPEAMTREELLTILKDHKRAEEALRLDEARLEALLNLNDMATGVREGYHRIFAGRGHQADR